MKLNAKQRFVHSLQHQSSRTALVMLSTCTLGSPAGDELRTRLEGGIAGLICPEEIEKPTEAGCSECSNMSCKIIRSWNVMWKIIGMSWNHEQMRRKKNGKPHGSATSLPMLFTSADPRRQLGLRSQRRQGISWDGYRNHWAGVFFLYKSSHVPAFTRRVLKWTSLTVSIKLDYLYRVMQWYNIAMLLWVCFPWRAWGNIEKW